MPLTPPNGRHAALIEVNPGVGVAVGLAEGDGDTVGELEGDALGELDGDALGSAFNV